MPSERSRSLRSDSLKTVLLTGGAGYVGAHCCKAFAEAGWKVVSFDDLSRGWREAVQWGPLIEANLLDREKIATAIRDVAPDLVIHLAAFAYVQESVLEPTRYYRNNCVGTLNLLDAMLAAGIRNLIFSSTCAVYGDPLYVPLDEKHARSPISPYGRSKLAAEMMIEDCCAAHGLSCVSLRYFNAAGADPDLQIGERHSPETHLIPLAIEAAVAPGAELTVMGSDFETKDGTAVRDYIHVSDLARAHVAAAGFSESNPGYHAFNLGSGGGTSVLEVIAAVERAAGKKPNYRVGQRREGDPGELFASGERARRELGWRPALSDIDQIVQTAIAWRAKG